jgi:hypothetical protein
MSEIEQRATLMTRAGRTPAGTWRADPVCADHRTVHVAQRDGGGSTGDVVEIDERSKLSKNHTRPASISA